MTYVPRIHKLITIKGVPKDVTYFATKYDLYYFVGYIIGDTKYEVMSNDINFIIKDIKSMKEQL